MSVNQAESFVANKFAPSTADQESLLEEEPKIFEFLWGCRTTNPDNIFVKSKTCESYTKGFVAIVFSILAVIGPWMLIFWQQMSSGCEFRFWCLMKSLGIWVLCVCLLTLGWLFSHSLIKYARETYEKIGVELEENPISIEKTENSELYEILECFYTNDSNCILVRSKTCDMAIKQIISAVFIVGISITIFTLAYIKTSGEGFDFMAILGSFMFTILIVGVIVLIMAFIIMLAKFFIRCQRDVRDEMNEKTSLLNSA